MGIFPVEFPSTTADSFESFQVLHYLAFIKGRLWGRRKGADFLPMEGGRNINNQRQERNKSFLPLVV